MSKRRHNLFRILWRWIRNSTVYFAIMLMGAFYVTYVPTNDPTVFLVGFVGLAFLLWPIVSSVRERLHF